MVDVFFVQFIDGVDVPVIMQRRVVSSTVEVPQIQFIDRVVDFSVVFQRRVPTVQTVQKTDEFPKMQFLDLVDMPVVVQRQVRSFAAMSSTHLSWRRGRFLWFVPEILQLQYIDQVVDVLYVQAVGDSRVPTVAVLLGQGR